MGTVQSAGQLPVRVHHTPVIATNGLEPPLSAHSRANGTEAAQRCPHAQLVCACNLLGADVNGAGADVGMCRPTCSKKRPLSFACFAVEARLARISATSALLLGHSKIGARNRYHKHTISCHGG